MTSKKEGSASGKGGETEAQKSVEHSFFCESMEDAQALAEELTVMGHKVLSVEKSDDEEHDGFLVETLESTTLSRAAINAGNLQVLGEEFNAVYDGWCVAIY